MNLECPRLSHHVLILLPPTSTSLAALAPIGGDEPQQSRCQPATPTDRYRADLPRRSHLVSAARPMRSALSLRDLGTGRRRPDLMSCVMAAQRSARQLLRGRREGVGCEQGHQTSGVGIETAGTASFRRPALHELRRLHPRQTGMCPSEPAPFRLSPVRPTRSPSAIRQAIRPAAYLQTVRRAGGLSDSRSGMRRLSFHWNRLEVLTLIVLLIECLVRRA